MDISASERVVTRIREGIEESRDSRIWPEYIRALNLISQVVFTRSAGFVLELIQNAEDSGRGWNDRGRFEISVNPARVKITHNGRPFDDRDVEALCGIRSSKKPQQGTLGYLGIGFKSVFKVTDAPEIYSGSYRFKFDKHAPAWADDPGSVPWHVTPIWLDAASEPVDPSLTTFILPFREPTAYQDLVAELRRLDTGLFLFLRWLTSVRMLNEATGDESTLENRGETEEGITVLHQGGRIQRFRVFRKTVSVPDWVKKDDLTLAYRRDVPRREIAIAFGVGTDGELLASDSGWSFGGIYSFIPLGEAKSGTRFRIQADFLVQPGRDAVNHEAPWNQWLVQEVATLAVEALKFFSEHETWCHQFLPVFRFTRSPGNEAYDRLFGPWLIDPLEAELRKRPCLPTADGGRESLENVVVLTEQGSATKALVRRGLLEGGKIVGTLGKRPGLKALHSHLVVPASLEIPQVNRWDLLRDREFLQAKAAAEDGPAWFRRLYLWLHENPWHKLLPDGRRSPREKRYYNEAIILASDGSLHAGSKVLLPSGLLASPLLSQVVEEARGENPVCHPGILDVAGEVGAGGKLFSFLTEKCGVRKLDAATVCRTWLLPRIRATAPKPSPEVLLEYSRVCMETLGTLSGSGSELWVLTTAGETRPGKEILFSSTYKPPQAWESLAEHLPKAAFLSPDYLPGPLETDELAEWRRFFMSAGVKKAPANGVEEAALNIALQMLGTAHRKVTAVHMRDLGYDLEVERADGEILRVEVKGLSGEDHVELTPNETRAAELYGDNYLLCVVSPIPTRPHIHLLANPTAPGRGARYALRVSPAVWREARWPVPQSDQSDEAPF